MTWESSSNRMTAYREIPPLFVAGIVAGLATKPDRRGQGQLTRYCLGQIGIEGLVNPVRCRSTQRETRHEVAGNRWTVCSDFRDQHWPNPAVHTAGPCRGSDRQRHL